MNFATLFPTVSLSWLTNAPFPWGVLASIILLILAYFLQHQLGAALEEDKKMWYSIGIFFVLYALTAAAIWWFMPHLDQPADLASLGQTILQR